MGSIPNSLLNRLRLFKNSRYSDEELHTAFQINKKKGWSIRQAWKSLQTFSDSQLTEFIKPILYRPFDVQWIFYHDSVVWRTVKKVMLQMIDNNLSLCVGRAGQVVGLEHGWNVVFCSQHMEDFNLFYRGGSLNMPLYCNPTLNKRHLFSQNESGERIPNLASRLIETLKSVFKKTPCPDSIFHYIYALLYSSAYREKYAEFLKTDFPRVPFTKDHMLFRKLAAKGTELVDLHLLKSKRLAKPIAKCEGSGDLKVAKVSHDLKKQRVYINPDKYFTGVPSEVWEYHIGGYQVCEKWLKDRKGRMLSSDEVATYTKVVTAIAETIRIQHGLDDLFKAVEASVMDVTL